MIIIKDILNIRRNLTTYSVGLLQTKAYRKLKELTTASLKPYDISSIEWAFLGVIFQSKDGIRSTELAEVLGVEAPFITALVPKFERKKILKYEKDSADGRVKKVVLTDDGRKLVTEIETILQKESRKWLSGLSVKEIYIYLKVIKKISEIR